MQREGHEFLGNWDDRSMRSVIRIIAASVQRESGRMIPRNVIMVADKWVYNAEVRIEGPAQHLVGAWAVDPSFSITPKTPHDLKMPVGLLQSRPLHRIVDDFSMGDNEITLIPIDENRIQEARSLGEITDETPNAFKVQRGEQTIHVYLPRDFTHVKPHPPDGTQLGWTELKE